MQQNSPKKICIIVDCLSGGGAEKQAAKFSVSLEKYGFKVTIVSLRDEITYPFNGKLYNLGKNEPSWKFRKQVHKFFAFKKAYNDCDAEIYIDFRTRSRRLMEWLFQTFVFEPEKMIMTIHNYHTAWHLPKGNYFDKWYGKTKAVVGVAQKIVQKLQTKHQLENVHYIPNYISNYDDAEKKDVHTSVEYIIAVGRLENDIKQFDQLIDAYHAAKLYEQNIHLYIFGDGSDRKSLQQQIENLQLTAFVKLFGFVFNVSGYMQNAKFLVLSSRVEGFPMVLLEALKHEIPLVAFDCNSGPSEIIQHETNGLLVPDQDFAALKDAMIRLVENSDLYEKCKQNTVSSLLEFTEAHVMRQWIHLINS